MLKLAGSLAIEKYFSKSCWLDHRMEQVTSLIQNHSIYSVLSVMWLLVISLSNFPFYTFKSLISMLLFLKRIITYSIFTCVVLIIIIVVVIVVVIIIIVVVVVIIVIIVIVFCQSCDY